MLSTFSTAMSLLLLATGGYFTLASGFFQFTHIGSIIKTHLEDCSQAKENIKGNAYTISGACYGARRLNRHG